MKTDPGFASRLLDMAREGGADEAEVYVKHSRGLSVEVRRQAVEAVESAVDFGYSLRLIRERRLGFSFSTDPADAEAVVRRALESSRWTEPDEFLDVASPAPFTDDQPLLVYDSRTAEIGEDEAISAAMAIEREAFAVDRRIKKARKASSAFSTRHVTIANTRGVDLSYMVTGATGEIMVVAEDGGESQTGWEFDGSRFVGDLSFGDIGRLAALRALRMLGARKPQPAKAPVILENAVAVEFLGVFSSLLSAEAVQKGKSLLRGRVGQPVISPFLGIVDDGTLPKRLGTRPFDDEGLPTARKQLIGGGVLNGFLHTIRTARKDGVSSTGNAVRGFMSLPAVGPSNLSLEMAPDRVVRGDLASLAGRGLYVTDAMGMHTANPVSGDFSIGVSGLWIEGGEVSHPVKEAVISGNLLDFFSRVEAAADDLRFYGGLAAPSLLFGPTDISA